MDMINLSISDFSFKLLHPPSILSFDVTQGLLEKQVGSHVESQPECSEAEPCPDTAKSLGAPGWSPPSVPLPAYAWEPGFCVPETTLEFGGRAGKKEKSLLLRS